ncbi:MAG TPA: hypothetical protein VLV78_07125 [Thermoanaerobaculia bacterium]|nr:hypothetical protein [Thermoanaerobaculia bacterium]
MKPLVVCALLVLPACSTTTYPVMPPPEIEIVQLYGPSDVPYSRGVSSVEAQYGVQITNPSADPVTLTHVSLQSVGNSTLAMRSEERGFNNVIPPGQTGQAVINARVYFTSDSSGSPTREPLTIRATLSFNSPKGSFTRIVQKNLSQFPQ